MRLLLDTNVFLWAASDPQQLSATAHAAIADRANDVYVSSAAALEIVIKYARGRLGLPMDPTNYLTSRSRALGIAHLPITLDHALAVAALPPIHRDPFDRLMIAQAMVEGLIFVTRDTASLTYSVKLMEA